MADPVNPFAKYAGQGGGVQPPPRRQPGPGVQPMPDMPRQQRRAPRPESPRAPPVLPPTVAAQPDPPSLPTKEDNPFAQFAGRSVKPATAAAVDPLAGVDFAAPFSDVRQQIAALPEEHRKPALDRWADHVVANERDGGGLVQGVSDRVRRSMQGVVGGWGDRLGASIASLTGENYAEALAHEQAQSRAATNATSMQVANLPLVGKVTEGDLWGVAGGVSAAPLLPVAPIARVVPYLRQAPASLLAHMVNVGATGAAVGGGVGYGTGNTEKERQQNAMNGALVGGMVGTAAPAVARVIGNAVTAAGSATAGLPATLRNYTRGSVDWVARAFEADNPGNTAQHGPEGMLADMGPSLRETTGGLMASPGPQQRQIYDPILGRRRGAQGRINADVDATLGPAQNLVELEENVMGQARRAARPLYQQFHQSQIPYTQDLVDILHAVPEAAVRKASQIARAERVDITRPEALPQLLDYIKRGLDDTAREAGHGTNLHRVYSNLARDLRTEVDRALNPADPAQSVYAQARRASGEGMQFREGLEEGGNTFNKATHPDQMRADLAGSSAPYEAGFVAGARGQIRDIMGNAAAAYGPNGDIAALKTLNAPYALQKFAQLVAPHDAARLGGRLAAEAEFNLTYDDVLRNSKTAVRMATQAGLPNLNANGGAGSIPHSVPGLVAELGKRAANILSGGVISARNRQVVTDMANMLVAQGVRREEIAYGLRQYLAHGQVTAAARPAIARVASDIMRGGQTAVPGNRYADRLPEFTITPRQ